MELHKQIISYVGDILPSITAKGLAFISEYGIMSSEITSRILSALIVLVIAYLIIQL